MTFNFIQLIISSLFFIWGIITSVIDPYPIQITIGNFIVDFYIIAFTCVSFLTLIISLYDRNYFYNLIYLISWICSGITFYFMLNENFENEHLPRFIFVLGTMAIMSVIICAIIFYELIKMCMRQ